MTARMLHAAIDRLRGRGDDGLTARERAEYAQQWSDGAARTPSRAEMDELHALARRKKALRQTG